MDETQNLADVLIRSYGLTVFEEDRIALDKSLEEVLAAANTIKLNRSMTDEPAATFKLRPASSQPK